MLLYVSVGADDLAKAGAFYDAVLAVVGMSRVMENDVEIGYGGPDGEPTFFVNTPYDKRPASFGNGVQVSFAAPNRAAVDAFHAAALAAGGGDEGAPGLRPYKPGYYGAYCRDPSGNKLHARHLPD